MGLPEEEAVGKVCRRAGRAILVVSCDMSMAMSGLSWNVERVVTSDAGAETFEADRCGERVVRDTVGPAEGVRPDSIFPFPKGLRSVKCCAVRSERLVPCEKVACEPASMCLAERSKVCRTTWREAYSAVESWFGCGRDIEKPISRSACPLRQESDRPAG